MVASRAKGKVDHPWRKRDTSIVIRRSGGCKKRGEVIERRPSIPSRSADRRRLRFHVRQLLAIERPIAGEEVDVLVFAHGEITIERRRTLL